MEYKVIKDFGAVAKKDEIFEVNDRGFAVLNVTQENDNYTQQRFAMLDLATVDELIKEGYLREITDERYCCGECQYCSCKKIEDTVGLIDGLLEKYKQNNEEVNEKASKGEIPPCVKVEADTVYYNLNKVLNRIKKELVDE